MTVRRAIIGLTMGDPAGIGPEIALKAVKELAPRVAANELDLVVIGTGRCLADCAAALGFPARLSTDGSRGPWPLVPTIEAAGARAEIPIGQVGAEAGRLAYHAVARAVELVLARRIDAIATAPLSKEALNLTGFKYAGHTDMLAALSGSRDSCMMLAHDRLRVSHVSTHVALSRVPALITRERVTRVVELTIEALVDLGIERPRIAVAALNPHAGEGGLFGDEDARVLVPVVESFRAGGVDIAGPLPGDTVFVRAVGGEFDAVVAMFHDQGHIPVKLLGFSIDPAIGRWTALSGVNVTLGLPFVRTSVDHGTAFDIAGRGIAIAQSMVEAIDYAFRLAAGRRVRVVA
ncbi:MAG: 4-hydroxythreonine-4-phosphate dehydrogenase PdxA [Pseudomonadota bacterium]